MKIHTTWRYAAVLSLGVCAVAMAGSDKDRNDQNVHLLKASDIMGMNVQNAGGEKLGSINDLAIDTGSGHARYAILSRGGAMGVGDTLYAVPCKAFKFTGGKEVCILDTTVQRLEAAPQFKADGWNTIGDERWGATVYEHYTIKPDFTMEKTTVKTTTSRPSSFIKGSDAVGMDVHNAQDEDLGEVNDLMIDVNSCRVGYAVLGFGGVLGVNEKLFGVPWQALNFNPQKKMFLLNVDKSKLKNAPGFDKNKWPDMNDVGWSKDVHAFYGSEPNWVYGYSSGASASAGTAYGWGLNDEYNRKFDSKSIQTVRGVITDVGPCTPMKGMGEAAKLDLQTDREAVCVHLGPAWFVDHQDRQFNKAQEIKVTGSRIELDGKPVIIATEIESDGQTLRLRDKTGKPVWIAWHDGKD